jgi:uncharacterized radical SAM protein YgiQ
VANYTSLGKPRRSCDFTPGGRNDRRPDRASIVYANLVRRYFKGTVPIVLGGIEASLRRIAHYDLRSNGIRRSLLLDAKADLLVYGMGERAVLDIADALSQGRPVDAVPGTCVAAREPPDTYEALPGFEEVRSDRKAFAAMFNRFYACSTRSSAPGLVQRHGERYLVHHPPARPLSPEELDRVHELPFAQEAHPSCKAKGEVRALETIRDSIITHRGCFGECSFCAIALHQGRSLVSRSKESILREARRLSRGKGFRGTIKDVGGPTANMYEASCSRLADNEPCQERSCIGYRGTCRRLRPAHDRQMELLREIERLPGVKNVFVTSGVRFDLILDDAAYGRAYLEQLLARHVSGQLKIAPEHCVDPVLELMNKPPAEKVAQFAELYRQLARSKGKSLYLSCYAIAAHPGTTRKDMEAFARFTQRSLRFVPEQVQIFTPTPSTRSTAMYWSGLDPFTGGKVWSEHSVAGKQKQKEILTRKSKHGKKR